MFAGVGGFRVGFERADSDWKTVWFSQWEPGKKVQHAYDCYVRHFGTCGENNNVDITNVDKESIPNHNVLVLGLPCQDYSVAHNSATANGIEGKKGVLWWQFYEVLKVKQPAFAILENVDRLLKSPAKQRGRDFGIMLYCLKQLGYNAEWRVINAAEYGEVQRRKRIFVFIYRRDTKYAQKQEKSSVQNTLQDTGFFASTFPINSIQDTDIRETVLQYNDVVSVSDNFAYKFGNCGYLNGDKVYTCDVETAYTGKYKVLRDILEPEIPEKYYITDKQRERWGYLKGAKKFERTSKTGFKYTYSEGPVSFPDDIDKPARTMLTSEGSCNRCSHAIKDPETHRLRIITPVEAERINGFEDNWTQGMPERMRYFCMGNALVVPLITKMAKTLGEIIQDS